MFFLFRHIIRHLSLSSLHFCDPLFFIPEVGAIQLFLLFSFFIPCPHLPSILFLLFSSANTFPISSPPPTVPLHTWESFMSIQFSPLLFLSIISQFAPLFQLPELLFFSPSPFFFLSPPHHCFHLLCQTSKVQNSKLSQVPQCQNTNWTRPNANTNTHTPHAWAHTEVCTCRFADFQCARADTHREMHTSSLHDPSLVCEPSVHLFQRTNTPDSAEELLSPFHCSLSSTIESTRWRDKLEQKLNAPRGELEIENHCSCPKPFH